MQNGKVYRSITRLSYTQINNLQSLAFIITTLLNIRVTYFARGTVSYALYLCDFVKYFQFASSNWLINDRNFLDH